MWAREIAMRLCLKSVIMVMAAFLSAHNAKAENVDAIKNRYEIRLGLLVHDVELIAAAPVEEGLDVNAELLIPTSGVTGVTTQDGILNWVLSPRLHLGAQVNTEGGSSQVYAGLTWTEEVVDGIWFGFAAGGARHNGETNRLGAGRKALGSKTLFRLSAELGVDLTDNLNVSLYFDHESNAYLASRNPGLDNYGVRTGWRF